MESAATATLPESRASRLAEDLTRYVPPVGAFSSRAPAAARRVESEHAQAAKLVRVLRSHGLRLLRAIDKPLIKRVIGRLQAIIEDPKANHLEVCYAAEGINRLLATAGEIAGEYGIDGLQHVVQRIEQSKQQLYLADAKIKRAELRAAQHKDRSKKVAEQMLAALRAEGRRPKDEGQMLNPEP